MIVAKGRNNAELWHATVEAGPELRLACRPEYSIKRKSAANYSRELNMCGNCIDLLNKLDLAWEQKTLEAQRLAKAMSKSKVHRVN